MQKFELLYEIRTLFRLGTTSLLNCKGRGACVEEERRIRDLKRFTRRQGREEGEPYTFKEKKKEGNSPGNQAKPEMDLERHSSNSYTYKTMLGKFVQQAAFLQRAPWKKCPSSSYGYKEALVQI